MLKLLKTWPRRLWILPLLLLTFNLAGCIGPKVNTCILDFNLINQAIDNANEGLTKAEFKTLMLNVKPLYCLPPDAKDNSGKFYLPLKTGSHVYSAEDWGILMRWIENHSK